MALVLVTYDLYQGDAADYSALHDELKVTPWWHWLESVWILHTEEHPDQVTLRLRPHIDQKDRLLVVQIDGAARQGWLPSKAWDWIRLNE